LVAQNRKVEAVKLVRDTAQCGLREAKDYVDDLEGSRISFIPTMPGDIDAQLTALLAQGKKLEAIKLHKDTTKAGLAESKDYVESLEKKSYTASTGAVFNKRETQIDDILKQQAQARVWVNPTNNLSVTKLIIGVLIIFAMIGLLLYLFGKH
jgi:ribosomal protein L7/L12